jgi:hypothetical protein
MAGLEKNVLTDLNLKAQKGRHEVDTKKAPAESENGTKPGSVQYAEAMTPPQGIGKETEAKLLKKLDRRIIPMCCWIYLMNFMDRGEKTWSILLS